jgi:hypothetical protein
MPVLELDARSARAIYQIGNFSADEQDSAAQRAVDIELSNENAGCTRVHFASSRMPHHLQVNLRIIPKITDHDSQVVGFMKILSNVWPNQKVTLDTIAELEENHFEYIFSNATNGINFKRVFIHCPQIIQRQGTVGTIFDDINEKSFILDGLRFIF